MDAKKEMKRKLEQFLRESSDEECDWDITENHVDVTGNNYARKSNGVQPELSLDQSTKASQRRLKNIHRNTRAQKVIAYKQKRIDEQVNFIPIGQIHENASNTVKANEEQLTHTIEELEEGQYITQYASEEFHKSALQEAPSVRHRSKVNIRTYIIGNGRILIAIPQGHLLHVNGCICVRSIVGSTSILGYILNHNAVAVTSVQPHGILSLKFENGLIPSNELKPIFENFGIETTILQDLATDYQDEPVSLVEVTRSKPSSLPSVIKLSSLWNVISKKVNANVLVSSEKAWEQHVGATPLIFKDQKRQTGVIVISPRWVEFVDSLEHDICKEKASKILVCGGLNVGKSTFLRFVVNSILGFDKIREIAVLDLDLGQSELFSPGSIGLMKLSTPLLGPPFSHRQCMKTSGSTEIHLGDANFVNIRSLYYVGLRRLLVQVKDLKVPLVVNTMGYVHGCGVDLMADLIRLLQPSHTVYLYSQSLSENFPPDVPITPDCINNLSRGWKTQPGLPFVVFNNTKIPSVTSSGKVKTKHAPLMRELNILSYFSRLWTPSSAISEAEAKKPKILSWDDYAVHNYQEMVVKSPLNLNKQLVSLQQVNDECMLPSTEANGKLIKSRCGWLNSSTLCGYGIVLKVDAECRTIHLLTPSSKPFNAIIAGNIRLPTELAEVFFQEYRDARDKDHEEHRHKADIVVRKCC